MTSSEVTPARTVANEVIRRVFELGAYADLALATVARKSGVTGRERAFAQHLAYGAVRRRGTSDHVINELMRPRQVSDLDVAIRCALRLGIFEVLFSGSADHAAVDQAVELAKRAGAGRGAGLVNAVLRRAVRERERLLGELDDSTPQAAAVKHSVPAWIAERWWEELGADDARRVLAAINEPSETALRINTLKTDPGAASETLAREGVEVSPPDAPEPLGLPEALLVDGPVDLASSGAFRQGLVTPQSRASMAVTHILDPRPGDLVLDLCAAPGIKASHIAARLSNRGEVTSVDRNEDRCKAMTALVERLGADAVRVIQADAAEGDFGGGYDRVLVDPPCSDLGTLASRPDARWRKSPEIVTELVPLQRRIVAKGMAALDRGGALVYSTCTISREENAGLVAEVLDTDGSKLGIRADELGADFPDLADPGDSRFLQIRPDRDGTDGFFIARMRREG